ncbi:MAG: hypothetical protein GXX84_19500 [Acidobacteria bacterium]|nr:hypothetical protein [Acidobacteriota bacterium]
MENEELEIAKSVLIPSIAKRLEGDLIIPAGATGVVLFAHGSGSSRFSSRNQFVARVIRQAGLGTLLFDLLTAEEEVVDLRTREFRFNIDLLARRLMDVTRWVVAQSERSLRLGYFGSSTGAAAALIAAANLGNMIGAVVSRGGRPDLAEPVLSQVTAPTLLIVGGRDDVVIGLNEQAYRHLHCKKQLEIIPGATHLFEEPGALERVAHLATGWFREHLGPTAMAKAS